jgi:ubiquinone/menaquinone biosynthesis C-methylase UbiE
MNSKFSTTENHGIGQLTDEDLIVYSVGISTGGIAEMRMAELPSRQIIATTIDHNGLRFAQEQIDQADLSDQIELKLEDVAEQIQYPDNYFDYIYARLVLHYLPRVKLEIALSSLQRVLKPGGRLYAVVRSNKCEHALLPDSIYDPETELTEYTESDTSGNTFRLRRHFFSEKEFAKYVEAAGFTINSVTNLDEHLFKDFMRTVPATQTDNLIELRATKPK